ncbi:MAG TPA: 8-amino-7-oxononanoate synthase [Burkholderiales bacterium]|jgi:8-amino-7-oxononanoate synthase|nr:8-amino-7-oxononanoate synthase [Burkholderiales bacterium]
MSAADLQAELDALREQSLLRTRRVVQTACGPHIRVDGRELLSFASNDYLGLAADPALIEAACSGARRWGVGSGASDLVSGHYAAHELAESSLALHVGLPRALLFSTGYMANVGCIGAMVGNGDAVFSDALNHASIIDGVRLCGAERHIYPHLDLAALEERLAGSRARRKLVVTDAVFSMDGDLAPLPALLELCERHDAWLMADDAHGIGVLGEAGSGSLSHWNIDAQRAMRRMIYIGTLGKAAGVSGAFAAGAPETIEWLVQRARTYIFTTGAPAMIATAIMASVGLMQMGDARRAHLRERIAQLRKGMQGRRWQLMESQTAIQPLVLGENAEALRVATGLLELDIWAPAIRPPTVPAGSARLRITLSAAHSEADVDHLLSALHALESP